MFLNILQGISMDRQSHAVHQAETKKLLDIVAKSLYTDKEAPWYDFGTSDKRL